MLFCVILVWLTKFENFLYFMQNVLEAWEFKENWLNILILGKLGSKQVFFEKHFISYSCILFTKFNALRSFCNILLCFSKILFPENFGLALCISINRNWFSINQKCNENFLAWFYVFRWIETNFRSIENCIESF